MACDFRKSSLIVGMIVDTPAKKLLFSTIRIEGTNKDGDGSIGTGFMLEHEIPGYGKEIFLVTNKHVVEGMEKAKLHFTRRIGDQPAIGNTFAFSCDAGFGTTFHGHPDSKVDIAVLPVSYLFKVAKKRADRDAFLMELSTKIIPSEEEVQKLDTISPVLFVGYPNGLYDAKHMIPIIRRGTTATPVELDYNGQPVFLIDASVFPGSSGSPVFSYTETWLGGMRDLRLLGIISSVYTQTETGELSVMPAPTQKIIQVKIQQMLDLGVVVKAHLIVEAILDCWKHTSGELRRFNHGS
jgi:hypothetical protein